MFQAYNQNDDVDSILSRNNMYFKDQGRILQIESCLQNLRKVTIGYTQQNPSDRSLEDELRKCEDQWEMTARRVENIRHQLQQIPAKWESYHSKFREMEQWMDHVDFTMSNIVREVNSSEEFEKEKAVFQVFLQHFFLILYMYICICT